VSDIVHLTKYREQGSGLLPSDAYSDRPEAHDVKFGDIIIGFGRLGAVARIQFVGFRWVYINALGEVITTAPWASRVHVIRA
jgi:hypothetical protein